MDRKEMLRMDTIYIPSNYTDAGKLLGAFALRQVAECAAICLPLAAMVFLTLVAGAVLYIRRNRGRAVHRKGGRYVRK